MAPTSTSGNSLNYEGKGKRLTRADPFCNMAPERKEPVAFGGPPSGGSSNNYSAPGRTSTSGNSLNYREQASSLASRNSLDQRGSESRKGLVTFGEEGQGKRLTSGNSLSYKVEGEPQTEEGALVRGSGKSFVCHMAPTGTSANSLNYGSKLGTTTFGHRRIASVAEGAR